MATDQERTPEADPCLGGCCSSCRDLRAKVEELPAADESAAPRARGHVDMGDVLDELAQVRAILAATKDEVGELRKTLAAAEKLPEIAKVTNLPELLTVLRETTSEIARWNADGRAGRLTYELARAAEQVQFLYQLQNLDRAAQAWLADEAGR